MKAEQNSLHADAPTRPTEALEGGIVDPPVEAAGPGDAATERLALRVGDLCLLCDPDLGREVILPPSVTPLPHTPEWLQGVASVRGALVPVIDPARLFGVGRYREHRGYLLISGTGEDAIGLLVDGLPVLERFETGERLAGVPPHPGPLDGHVRGAYHRGGAVWLDVDVQSVFAMLGTQIAA